MLTLKDTYIFFIFMRNISIMSKNNWNSLWFGISITTEWIKETTFKTFLIHLYRLQILTHIQ